MSRSGVFLLAFGMVLILLLSGCVSSNGGVSIPGIQISDDGDGKSVSVNAGDVGIAVDTGSSGTNVDVSGVGADVSVNTGDGDTSVSVGSGASGTGVDVGVTGGTNVIVNGGDTVISGPYCGDGSCSSDEDCVLCQEDCGECDVEVVQVSGIKEKLDFSPSERVILRITGIKDTVTVKSGSELGALYVEGVDDEVFLEEDVALERLVITGIGCRIELPCSLEPTLKDTGINTEIECY